MLHQIGWAPSLPTILQPACLLFADDADDPGPGPGTYEPSSQLMSKGGAFGSSTRDGARQPANPAPGDYGGAWDADLKRQPKYSFRTKSVPDHFKSKTPGPGTVSFKCSDSPIFFIVILASWKLS